MQIQPVSIPLDQTSGSGSMSSSSGAGTSSSNPLDSTNSMFMDLLTAQLENQSPFDPIDPTQFTSQLVQFNMLDQLTQINSVLQQGLGETPNPSGAAAVSGGN